MAPKTKNQPLVYTCLIFLPFSLSKSFYIYLLSFSATFVCSTERGKMKVAGGAKLILLQQGGGSVGGFFGHSPPRLWLMALLCFFTFLSLLSLFHRHATLPSPTFSSSTPISGLPARNLPSDLFEVLLHYATTDIAAGWRMPDADLKTIAAAIRRRSPCNLLIFGLGHETLLWRSINHGGRTVFVDEDGYLISRLEERHRGLIEAYDVKFPKKIEDLADLLAKAKAERKAECRPVQNLLFSDCRLAINDLPNDLYDVAWDVILVDGPRGYGMSAPGRISAIFTAGVMARSGGGGGSGINSTTEVLVHDYDRELEKTCSEEFLCKENLVAADGKLGHFSVSRPSPDAIVTDFCRDKSSPPPDRRHDFANRATLKPKKKAQKSKNGMTLQ